MRSLLVSPRPSNLTNGNSRIVAIRFASSVLPVLGGPVKRMFFGRCGGFSSKARRSSRVSVATALRLPMKPVKPALTRSRTSGVLLSAG